MHTRISTLIPLFLLFVALASAAPHSSTKGEDGVIHEVEGWMSTAWKSVKMAFRKIKIWVAGENSIFRKVMNKLKQNQTVKVFGKDVSFSLSTDNVEWGSSITTVTANLQKQPVLRVLLALYLNIILFVCVYAYLIARHIMMSMHLKKASQPEKERERRRLKERKKLLKKAQKNAVRGQGTGLDNVALNSFSLGEHSLSMRSPGIEVDEGERRATAHTPLAGGVRGMEVCRDVLNMDDDFSDEDAVSQMSPQPYVTASQVPPASPAQASPLVAPSSEAPPTTRTPSPDEVYPALPTEALLDL